MTSLRSSRMGLFHRQPDECFMSLTSLAARCGQVRAASRCFWQPPSRVTVASNMQMVVDSDDEFALTDWAFGRICRLCNLNKPTMNRLTRRMASQVFQRTWPQTTRPWGILATHHTVRDICGFSYSRLWNCEVLNVLREFESAWQPPAVKELSCGLYFGEQDMFCFLINPAAVVEIGGSAFTPGIAVWNSEVGSRPLGIQAFWHEATHRNHLLWDPIWKRPFVRRHLGHVRQGLEQMRRLLDVLSRRHDQRRNAFARVARKAQRLQLARRADEACSRLRQAGLPQWLACAAIESAQRQSGLTILAVVQALTRLSAEETSIGARTALDAKASRLLALAN